MKSAMYVLEVRDFDFLRALLGRIGSHFGCVVGSSRHMIFANFQGW